MNTIYVVGIGPGEYRKMTIEAADILKKCDVIVGYTVYVDLIREYFPQKEMLTTPMKQETDRCRMAFEEAAKGKNVAVICSGDAGIYGMAGLMVEMGQEHSDINIEILPGVTAAAAGAALLGAPVGHDFAVISLSDLLTPWEVIEKRLRGAAMADFVICIYNPSSKKRKDYLKRACEIILESKRGRTVCGLASKIGREGEHWEILTLEELKDRETDMFTTVFIGNDQTKVVNGRMVTPRGYRYE